MSWFACVFFEAGIHGLLFKYLDFMLQRVSSNGSFCCLLLFRLKTFDHNIQSYSSHMICNYALERYLPTSSQCRLLASPLIPSDLGSFNFVKVVLEGTSFGIILTHISCIIDIYIPKKGAKKCLGTPCLKFTRSITSSWHLRIAKIHK